MTPDEEIRAKALELALMRAKIEMDAAIAAKGKCEYDIIENADAYVRYIKFG